MIGIRWADCFTGTVLSRLLKLKSIYYSFVLNRKFELYSMGWADQVNLSEVLASAGTYGGPIGKIIGRFVFVVLCLTVFVCLQRL